MPPLPEPKWLVNFRRYDGVQEIKGPKTSPAILRMIDLADGKLDAHQLQGIKDDETPYCSSFKCGVYEEVGIVSPRSAWARDWLKFGVSLIGPAPGATVVFERGTGGHVGDVVGRDAAGHVMVLGANQGDMVKISPFDTKRVLGYRWPAGFALPVAMGLPSLPLLKSDGTPSINEA